MAKISVIIPIYNASKYLSECLKSVVEQTFQDLEIICINDGSIDYSLEIIREFQKNDPRIILVDQKNQGVSAARNAGLEIATGKYILFLDGDDLLTNDAINKMGTHSNFEEDLLLFNFSYLYEEGRIINVENLVKNYNISNKEELILDYLQWNLKIRIGSFFINNQFLRKHNLYFQAGQSYAEDVEFIVLALYHALNVRVLQQNINTYRINENSAVAQINYKRFESFFSRERLFNFFKKEEDFANIVNAYRGYLLPEAIITIVKLFARDGLNFFQLMNFLKENKMIQYLEEDNFNVYTPKDQKIEILSFLANPFYYFIKNRFFELQYQFKVFIYKKLKQC